MDPKIIVIVFLSLVVVILLVVVIINMSSTCPECGNNKCPECDTCPECVGSNKECPKCPKCPECKKCDIKSFGSNEDIIKELGYDFIPDYKTIKWDEPGTSHDMTMGPACFDKGFQIIYAPKPNLLQRMKDMGFPTQ